MERLQLKNASLAPKYKEICTKTIKCGIEMKTSLDIFGRTDARAFSVVLADITHLRAIQLWSNHVAPHEITDKGFRKRVTPDDNPNVIVVEKLISQLPAENAQFFCTVHKHFARSSALQLFHLVNLKLGRDAWSNIARGIGKSKSLRELRLNKCNLSCTALELLLGGVGKSDTLETIDLSHNDMEDSSCGTAVVKLLQA